LYQRLARRPVETRHVSAREIKAFGSRAFDRLLSRTRAFKKAQSEMANWNKIELSKRQTHARERD
jgi:hypothetical protein